MPNAGNSLLFFPGCAETVQMADQESPPDEGLVRRTVGIPKWLDEQIAAEMRALGGIDFPAFCRLAFAEKLRVNRLRRQVEEEQARYGANVPKEAPPNQKKVG
jgi:16S rRNA C967 or C1407 C5-methylase (RsmB/RsmF family)